MNTDQLRYLIDIAKTGSINTTAKRMFSSQQAISESIKRLENELNCIILERSKRGVTLTADGKFVLQHSLAIIEHYQTLQEHFSLSTLSLHGMLRIGAAPFATKAILSDLIFKMYHYYPNLALYTTELPVETILIELAEGTLDFGISAFSDQGQTSLQQCKTEYDQSLTFTRLYEDQLVCAMHKNNPLAINKAVTSAHLQQAQRTRYPYPNYSSNESCLHISNNTEIHKKFMQEENTVCFMPLQFFKASYPEKDFIALPMTDTSPVVTCLVYPKQVEQLERNPLQQTFIKTVLELTQRL